MSKPTLIPLLGIQKRNMTLALLSRLIQSLLLLSKQTVLCKLSAANILIIPEGVK